MNRHISITTHSDHGVGIVNFKHFNDAKDLSFSAIGLLITMVNMPECDYVSPEKLHESLQSDSVSSIKNALTELLMAGYVIRVNDVYAINKDKIARTMSWQRCVSMKSFQVKAGRLQKCRY